MKIRRNISKPVGASTPIRSRIFHFAFLLILLGSWCISARAQNWKIVTPRDTISIPANTMSPTTTKLGLTNNIAIDLKLIGTYGLWAGQNGSGFDAAYTFSIPNWNAPFPLLNPPSYNGTSYQIFLGINTTGFGNNFTPIKVNEGSYQGNHRYTARYTSSGAQFQFRISDRLDERPDGYYYGTGTGQLSIQLAQFTAGIAVQNSNIDFGNTPIGKSVSILDSIESYGIDPLQVDSVRIVGSSDFSFGSQRGSQFVLSSETTNEFTINYTPSVLGYVSGFLYIFSGNTDKPNHLKAIALQGFGASPKLAVGPSQLDFGKIPVFTTSTLAINVFDRGNAPLNVTSVRLVPANAPFKIIPSPSGISAQNPFVVPLNQGRQFKVDFTPPARQKYHAMFYIQGEQNLQDSVSLDGEGAQPSLTLSQSKLDFGKVLRLDRSTRTFTLKNTGNYTAKIARITLTGPDPSAYTFIPSQTSFLLNADSSRTYTVVYSPTTGPEGSRLAFLQFILDNGDQSSAVELDGLEAEPKLALDAKIVDFGKVKLGGTARKELTMENTSQAAINFNTSLEDISPLKNPFGIVPRVTVTTPGKDSIGLTFTPTVRGPIRARLFIDAEVEHDSVYLLGIGAKAVPLFEPSILDYQIVPTGVGAFKALHLRDTGDYPLYIDHLDIVGSNASDFTITNPPRNVVVRDGSADTLAMTVKFQTFAKTGLVHTAILIVTYSDSTRDSVALIAREQAQFIEFGSRSLDFGKVRVNRNSTLPATFSNGANVTLSVGSIWITPSGSPFRANDTALNVGAQSVQNSNVTFSPVSRGVFTALLHADRGNIKADSITLTGTGATPVPSFSDTALDFGTIKLGLTKSMTFRMKNIGDWTMQTNFAVVNDAYGEFSVSTSSGSLVNSDTVAESAYRDYTVTFHPTQPQLLHTAEVRFVFDDSTSQMVHLIGKDISNYLVLDSSRIDFGKVRIGAGPVTKNVNIVNTALNELTAGRLYLTNVTGAPGSLAVSPLGLVRVSTRTASPVSVSFSPQASGSYSATLIGDSLDMKPDTVFITGIGAKPMAQLSTSLADFGQQFFGQSKTLTVSLTNAGNWPLHIIGYQFAGARAADYAAMLAKDTTIAEGGTRTFTLNFLATSPQQQTPRQAIMRFTEDDGTTFDLALTELDKAPFTAEIAFGDYAARPGDQVRADLKLITPIPATTHIRKLSGEVHFDPAIVDLLSVAKGASFSDSSWHLASTQTIGVYSYTLQSWTSQFSTPGSLLQFLFKVHTGLPPSSVSPLANVNVDYPEAKEIRPAAKDGTIVVDSSCGSISVNAGEANATFVQQNTPNPFGAGTASGNTQIPFDVATDGTSVTVRILDVTGAKVLTPLDHSTFDRGHYTLHITGNSLPSGIYFYEFRTDGAPPTIKKMVVRN